MLTSCWQKENDEAEVNYCPNILFVKWTYIDFAVNNSQCWTSNKNQVAGLSAKKINNTDKETEV